MLTSAECQAKADKKLAQAEREPRNHKRLLAAAEGWCILASIMERPMLVIDGRLHPRFDRRSTSLKARNGVGVPADGKVIFAISQGEVSFDAFARLFRDGLNCPNALFLDGGSAPSLYAPSLNRHGNIVSLGPMLAVFERGASRQ
jgi:uncharacterized protein YigE (DUF2233 family)